MPTRNPFKLRKAPIVEAVVDFLCDLDPALDRSAFEKAAKSEFGSGYPEARTAMIHESELSLQPNQPPRNVVKQQVIGYQVFSKDRKQIVQPRFNGFSFNRLAPYESLDDYLVEIKRCWDIYQSFSHVRLIRRIGLRYINRIPLPAPKQQVSLNVYLKNAPTFLSEGERPPALTAFVHQHQIKDPDTGNDARVVLASQPFEGEVLPIILDIDTFRMIDIDPNNWESVRDYVASLRDLKNRLFRFNLTSECLKLFQ